MSKSERDSVDKTLQSLLSAIAEDIEYVEKEVESLYNNWFIETSNDWVISYIANLLYEKYRFHRLVLRDLPVVLSCWIKYAPIDIGITLVEMFTYLADVLSYYQDSIANEAHITTAGKEVKVVLQLLGIRKHNIKISVHDNLLEVTGTDLERRYHRVVQLPLETNIETGRSIYENGILEVTFQKKEEQNNQKGMQINIE